MLTEERVLAALNHQESDRVPVWTRLANAAVYRHFAPRDFDFAEVKNTDEPFSTAFQLLYKRTFAGLGIDVTFSNHNPFPSQESPGQTNWRTRSTLQTIEDVVRFMPKIPTYEDVARNYVANFRKIRSVLEPHTLYISQGTASIQYYNVFGLELFCAAMYEASDHLGRILDAYSEAHRIETQVYADYRLAPVYQVSCDVGGKNGTLFSPDYLRREAFPRLRREIEPLKQAGIKIILHSDGNITEVLDDLVEIGIDGINPLETSAGMNLALIKKRYGKNLVLVGNVDGAYVLPLGSPRDVEEEVKRCIREGAPGGGYFLDTGSGEVTSDIPVENALAMFEAIRKYGSYPVGD